MKNKLECILGFCILLFYHSNAQEKQPHKFSHSLYAEFLGATYVGYSLNYELIVRDKYQDQIAIRIGGGKIYYTEGLYPDSNISAFALPVELLMILGKINSSSFEIGICGTPSFGDRAYNGYKGTKYPATSTIFYHDFTPSAQFGYRYQSDINHLIVRLDLTFLILSRYYNPNSDYQTGKGQVWFGLSFGYCLQ